MEEFKIEQIRKQPLYLSKVDLYNTFIEDIKLLDNNKFYYFETQGSFVFDNLDEVILFIKDYKCSIEVDYILSEYRIKGSFVMINDKIIAVSDIMSGEINPCKI